MRQEHEKSSLVSNQSTTLISMAIGLIIGVLGFCTMKNANACSCLLVSQLGVELTWVEGDGATAEEIAEMESLFAHTSGLRTEGSSEVCLNMGGLND